MGENKSKRSLSRRRKAVVLSRDGYRCQYCGVGVQDGAILEVDHRIPIAKGGCNRVSNLITACRDCNRSKRDKLLELPTPGETHRSIINADGTVTTVLPKGRSADDLARSMCGQPEPCLSCGEPAMHRVVWESPHLRARPNKKRSFIYPICDACGDLLFSKQDAEIGGKIDDILVRLAGAAEHKTMVASTEIGGCVGE